MSERSTLTRLDVLRGLRISTWEAIWATVWTVLTTGAFQTGFALQMGASPFALGLLAGLPAAVNLLQLPASVYVEKRGERRTFVGFAAVAGRLIWALILFLPFVLPHAAQLPVFLVLLTVSSALLSITVPAWTSWMSDLVPAGSRGQYFGRRNMLAGLVSMLVPLPAGAFLDQAMKYGRFDPRLGFAVLFGVACVAAIAALVLILRQPEPPMARHAEGDAKPNPLRSLSAPLADIHFRRFLFFAGATVFGQALTGQFFTAWQVSKDALNLPYLTVQLLGAVAALAGLAATPIFGYVSDKYGSKPVLSMSSAGTIIAPLVWMLTVPSSSAMWVNVGLIILINICSGAFWGGVGLAQFNLLLTHGSAAGRSTYVAVFSAVTGLVGAMAPILGGTLMEALEPVHLTAGPLLLNNYKIMFLMTALVRIGCLFLLNGIHEAEGQSTRYVLGQLMSARPLTSYRTLKRLARPVGEGERLEAVEALADLRSPLAVEELVNALDDVSFDVREGAAQALGAIGDPRAIPALIEKLFDPAAGVGELAAQSLGAIGDRTATAALVRAASGPDATVRVAALKALARLADPAAAPALIPLLDPSHPTSTEAALGVITAIGSHFGQAAAQDALPRLLYLLSQEVDRGMRLAAARALHALAPLLATQPEAFEILRARLQQEDDAAVAAQEAVALSRLGRTARREIGTLLQTLLPVAHRPDAGGLAAKQALEAVAEVGLPEGSFYPYLGLSEMARDETASRLFTEVRRRLGRAAASDTTTTTALEAYTSGNYPACLTHLVSLIPSRHVASPPAQVLRVLADTATQRAEAPPEEALLGILLLRETLS